MNSNQHHKHFLSLKWKTLFLLFAVLVIINCFLMLIGYQHLQHFFEQQLSQSIQQNANALLKQSRQRLLELGSATSLSANRDIGEGLIESVLEQHLNNNWYNLQLEWGLESISLHNEGGNQVKSWGYFQPSESISTLAETVLLEFEPKTQIQCSDKCRILAALPIVLADGTTKILILSTTLVDFIIDFSLEHDLGAALVRNKQESPANNPFQLWDYHIVGITHKHRYQEYLLTLNNELQPKTFLQQGMSLKINDQIIYFHAIPIELKNNNIDSFIILMSDVTEQRNAIYQNLIILGLILCGGLMASLIAMFLVLKGPMQRIKKQSELLPLLAKSGFSMVRKEIKKRQREGLTHDELDILEETAISLSHQLELMEKEIGSRTNELEHMALYDVLTGLANRRLFSESLAKITDESQLTGEIFAVIFIDLDNFKRINDSLGHDAGDQLLIEVGKRLTETVRPTDIVARLGGDEFTLILANVKSTANVRMVMDKILLSFVEIVHIGTDKEVVVSPSIGVAIGPEHGTEVHELMRCADLAMYHAKQEGKNCYHFFDSGMNEEIQNSMRLEKEINNAILKKQFRLYYQPIVDLRTGKVVMLEALLRWLHPVKGLLAPFEFIDMLEESGKIVELGPQLFEMSCLAIKLLDGCGLSDINIAINISAKQFKDPQLIEKLSAVLEQTKVTPDRLELEITENTLMEDLDRQCELLTELKEMGYKLAIDDFGTGYSSLSYLKELPVDVLKIDRSFIKDIPFDKQDIAITSAIAAMAYKLDLKVVAEGIETIEQQRFLEELGCEYGQGYIFQKPKALETFITYLKENDAEVKSRLAM